MPRPKPQSTLPMPAEPLASLLGFAPRRSVGIASPDGLPRVCCTRGLRSPVGCAPPVPAAEKEGKWPGRALSPPSSPRGRSFLSRGGEREMAFGESGRARRTAAAKAVASEDASVPHLTAPEIPKSSAGLAGLRSRCRQEALGSVTEFSPLRWRTQVPVCSLAVLGLQQPLSVVPPLCPRSQRRRVQVLRTSAPLTRSPASASCSEGLVPFDRATWMIVDNLPRPSPPSQSHLPTPFAA